MEILKKNKIVMEIGSWLWKFNRKAFLQMKPKKIFAIEKDKKLASFLKKKFKILKI